MSQPDKYFEGMQLDVKQLQAKATERAEEFQRLCYVVFHEFPEGAKLWERLRDMYLMNSQVDPRSNNASECSLWWDGFKSSLLGLYNHGLAHIKRVNGV